MCKLDIVIPAKDPSSNFIETIDKWLVQILPDGWDSRLFLVDDGSCYFDFDAVARRYEGRLTLITHVHSRGRAAARNAGMQAGEGSHVAFFDADCFPAHEKVLARFIEVLEEGADLVYGALTSQENSFWGRYFSAVCAQRERRFSQGDLYALTTACCVVRRELLERIGGFDERYKHYGFEDRDLIIRLMMLAPSAAFSSLAVVVHNDDLDIDNICRKQQEAGRYTSGLFRASYPSYYAGMKYALVDYRRRGLLCRITLVLLPLLPGLLVVARKAIGSKNMPFALKVLLVKMLSAMFYFKGTRQAEVRADQ